MAWFQLWQAFVGVRARRVERYYQDLLAQDSNACEVKEHGSSLSSDTSKESSKDGQCAPEKWKRQIEKVIRCMDFELKSSILSICRCYLALHANFSGVSH